MTKCYYCGEDCGELEFEGYARDTGTIESFCSSGCIERYEEQFDN